MEFGGDKVREAVDELDDILQDTGSQIGKTRRKFANLQAPVDEINKIEDSFRTQLDKLNLEIRKGKVVQKTNSVSKVGSKRDINVLDELYNDLLATKQSPNLENLLDLRSSFDNKIKFGKTAREVSNAVDPASRQVRREIADAMEKIVGPENAAELQKYSEVIDARNILEDFTSRKAGGEYLLRVALSGRGGEARKIIETVRNITVNDLATEAVIMTDMINRFASDAQKTLFRQQIKNSGIGAVEDLFGASRGDLGAVSRLLSKGIDKTIDEQDVLLRAAGGAN
jgi:hypothetical protein